MVTDKARTPTGLVNSVHACSALDGPSLRFVVFLQGCLFRCQYCHNPETLALDGGFRRSIESLLEEIETYRCFFESSSGGGITVSGGEPLLQKKFVARLFEECKLRGIDTALDTNGYTELDEQLDDVLRYTDLVILDVKAIDDRTHTELTEMSNKKTLALARYLDQKKIPTWIRQVIVHPYTDTIESAQLLAEFLEPLENITRVELVPFHNLASEKWDELGLDYKMRMTEPPTAETMQKLAEVLRAYGIEPVCA